MISSAAAAGQAGTTEESEPAAFFARPPATRNAALQAALTTETCIAEALSQRSRGLVSLFERLTQRMLAEASDLADARTRLGGLCRSLDAALSSGEAAAEGDLRALATRTLLAFETGPGPRILVEGPMVSLEAEAGRLVSLALFDLASRSLRFGALGAAEGRVALGWTVAPDGLRLTWREFGVRPGAERMRQGAGASLQALLAERFGAQLRQTEAPFGLVAELALPAAALRGATGPMPRRVLVAVADAAAAVTLGALLMACGVVEIGAVHTTEEAADALGAGGVDLALVDAALAEADCWDGRPTVLVLGAEEAVRAGGPRVALRLPIGAAGLAAAMSEALAPDDVRPERARLA